MECQLHNQRQEKTDVKQAVSRAGCANFLNAVSDCNQSFMQSCPVAPLVLNMKYAVSMINATCSLFNTPDPTDA